MVTTKWVVLSLWWLCLRPLDAVELAIVRPFATDAEAVSMQEVFALWSKVPPCAMAPLNADVDLILMYSMHFETNPAALAAATELENGFANGTYAWAQCFRSLTIHQANLTSYEDIYDARGYEVRRDWVNGPNLVFRAVLKNFMDGTFGNYSHFYYMEFDAVPVREMWMDQFVTEALFYPEAAIRGSHFRGDTWDTFLTSMPVELLYHINGNAIYNVRHPWLQFLATKLDEDAADAAMTSIAFDVRMANLTYEEFAGGQDTPYRGDSLLVGNYAQTLLNDSFQSEEYIRHGSLQNVFQNINDTEVTLGVVAQHADLNPFLATLQYSHPFRKVIIMGKYISNETNYTIQTQRGETEIETRKYTGTAASILCKLASHVTTRYLALSDTHSRITSPTDILVNAQGDPILPYVAASSWSCAAFQGCTSELDEAESFYGVRLDYHHDTFETVYYTDLYQQHCEDRALVLRSLPKYSQCGFVHPPTADGYIAWMLSRTGSAFDYVPKAKQQVGFRAWNVLAAAHPVDPRRCSVYRQEDFLVAEGNISSCSLIIEDPTGCVDNVGCTWKPMFGSGKCIDTPQVPYTLMTPQLITTTTTTVSATTFTSTTSSTFTVLPGQCRPPTADSAVDLSDCQGKEVGQTCQASCLPSFDGSPTTLTCSEEPSGNAFVGAMPVCQTTTQTMTSTSTKTELVICSGGLPSGRGVITSDCVDKANGQTCQATCDTGFQGGPAEYYCEPSTGLFQGPSLACLLPSCSTSSLPTGFDASDCDNTEVGSICFLRCPAGYLAAQSVYSCGIDQNFTGTPPVCERIQCSVSSIPFDIGANTTACLGTVAGDSCEVTCMYGYEGSPANQSCGADGMFTGPATSCTRKACPIPSDMVGDLSFSTDCAGVKHGDLCMGTCNEGYSGSPKQMDCDNGILLGEKPNCTALTCSLEGVSIGVGVTAEACVGTTTGRSCDLGCTRGYEGVGSANMSCQTDGSFARSTFSCAPTKCLSLSSISPFSEPQFADSCVNQTYGDICTTFCSTGWDIQGNATVMVCDATPETSAHYAEFVGLIPAENSTGPVCMSKMCVTGVPSRRGIEHDCVGKTTLQTCSVTAAFGFTMTATPLTCGVDGGFQGNVPEVAEATCAAPDFGEGVGSTCGNLKIGAECYAYCLTNYTGDPQPYRCVANDTTATIQVEAQGSNISCVADGGRRLAEERMLAASCGQAAVDAFGLNSIEFLHSCDSLVHDDVCISHCSRGYELSGAAALTVCDNGALVGSALPTCVALPCTYNVPSAVGLEHNCTNVTTGGTCQAGCTAPGFEYASGNSASEFKCEATSEFNGTLPSCQRVTCTDLTMGPKFAHNCAGMVFQDTCGVSCAKGWTLVGWGSQFECMADGTIAGAAPDCVGNPCANTIPTDAAFSGEDCDGMTTDMQCNVTCKPGSTPNSAIMTCDASGHLIGTLPICKPAECPANPMLQDPSIAHNCQGIFFGRSCSVFCAPGYELRNGGSGEVWQCDLGGSGLSLTGVLPVCEQITCPSLGASDILVDNCSAMVAGESCEQTCKKGYLPASSNTTSTRYNCDLQGQVSSDGSSLQCDRIECNSNIVIPNVDHTCTNVLSDRSCFAFCSQGYRMQQSQVPQWSCASAESGLNPVSNVPMIDGYTLRGEVPVCTAIPCLYNVPFGIEYTDDCTGTATAATCTVSCAAGYYPGMETWTCLPDGTFNGTYPVCLEITSTATSTSVTTTLSTTTSSMSSTTSVTSTSSTTTFWNGTVLLTGSFDLTPLREEDFVGRRLETAEVRAGFLGASLVEEGLTNALAYLLNVEPAAVKVNLTIAVDNETEAELVRCYYDADRAFPTQEEADNFTEWLASELNGTSTGEVQDLMNSMLNAAGADYRIGVLHSMTIATNRASEIPLVIELELPPEEEEEYGLLSYVMWYVGLILCVFVIIGLCVFLWYFVIKNRKEEAATQAAQKPAVVTTPEDALEEQEDNENNENPEVILDVDANVPLEPEGLRLAAKEPIFEEEKDDEPLTQMVM